jgi:hypothetical protein
VTTISRRCILVGGPTADGQSVGGQSSISTPYVMHRNNKGIERAEGDYKAIVRR